MFLVMAKVRALVCARRCPKPTRSGWTAWYNAVKVCSGSAAREESLSPPTRAAEIDSSRVVDYRCAASRWARSMASPSW